MRINSRSWFRRYSAALRRSVRGFADELARVKHDPDGARVMALRAGFPPEDLPDFRVPRQFWNDIVRGAMDGRCDLLALVEDATAEFPSNSLLKACRRDIERDLASSAADPQPDGSHWARPSGRRAGVGIGISLGVAFVVAFAAREPSTISVTTGDAGLCRLCVSKEDAEEVCGDAGGRLLLYDRRGHGSGGVLCAEWGDGEPFSVSYRCAGGTRLEFGAEVDRCKAGTLTLNRVTSSSRTPPR